MNRVGLETFPTPIQAMKRLGEHLGGPKLYIKRDDLSDLAMGGNKVRQLDYVLIEAKKKKADTLIATCGVQSNWSRQVVGASIKLGMDAVLVLRTLQFKEKPSEYDGNILLDYIMGAKIKVIQMGPGEDPQPFLEKEAEELRKKGKRPHILGLDALASPEAAVGYVEAMREMHDQLKGAKVDFDAIFVPGGGPTHAGALLGAKIQGMKARIIGIPVSPSTQEEKVRSTLKIAAGAAKLVGSDVTVSAKDVEIDTSFAGERYGLPTEASLEAISLVARNEAIILDPVYTSKVMSGMISKVRAGKFKKSEKVCFIHTGGVPALFPYRGYFQPPEMKKPITML
jgi:L-cysteate sulfo-lyase